MSVGFHTFVSREETLESNKTCTICLDDLVDLIAHDGPYGDTHPWCVKCIKDWIPIRPECPSCRVSLDNSLFSIREIMEINMRNFIKKAEKGASDEFRLRVSFIILITKSILGCRLTSDLRNEEEQDLRGLIRICLIVRIASTALAQLVATSLAEPLVGRDVSIIVGYVFGSFAAAISDFWIPNTIGANEVLFDGIRSTLPFLTMLEVTAFHMGIKHGITTGIISAVVLPSLGLLTAAFQNIGGRAV